MDKFLNRGLPTGSLAGNKHKSDGQTVAKDDYEKKRKRLFVPSWKREYLWLEYNQDKDEMFCKICRQFPGLAGDNPFTKGTNNFRKDPIKAHDASKSHKKCSEAKLTRDKPGQTPMARIVARANEQQFEKMTKLFRTAYYIAKEELPLRKFDGLCQLQRANGVDFPDRSYSNDHACREFIRAISHTEQTETIDQISSCRFLSVLSDGSTDSGIIEQEVVYVRFVQNCQPVSKMVQCQSVNHAHAAGILEAIDTAVETVGIDQEVWNKKVVCANFDGASVMMGEKTGVAARLKSRVPHIITLHCIAHKLELAVLDAVKDCPYLIVFEETLKSIFKFYYYSTKKRRQLTEIGELLDEKVAHFSGLKSTRWLPSRLRCLKAIMKNYSTVVTHMENTASSSSRDVKPEDAAKAKGIVQEMKTQRFVQFLHFMLDYSSILAKCSENFQYDDVTLVSAKHYVESTTTDLLKLKTMPGEQQQSLKATLITEEDQVTYKGVKLTTTKRTQRQPAPVDPAPWKADFTAIINNTVKYIDTRFSIFSKKPISCFSVFDPTNLPCDREKLATYGHDEIADLVAHFSDVLTDEEVEKIPREWTYLKVWIAAHRNMKIHRLLPEILQHASDSHDMSNVAVLVELLLTLSPSTAICERGFSCMNRVKTVYRTCLKAETLNDLMLLSTNGDEVVDFRPELAVRHWLTSGKGTRHLSHKTPVRLKKASQEKDVQLQQPQASTSHSQSGKDDHDQDIGIVD